MITSPVRMPTLRIHREQHHYKAIITPIKSSDNCGAVEQKQVEFPKDTTHEELRILVSKHWETLGL